MAIRGHEIRNPKTGQRIKFLQTTKDTKGLFLEMLSTYEARSIEPPAHYHPFQEEYIEVLSGEITVRINGEVEVLGPGHQLYIAKNTAHAVWNNTNQAASLRWKVVPALDTERFLETVTGLAHEGKIGADGRPGILQVALTANRFCNVFRFEKPPYFLQKIAYIVLTPLAYIMGYQPETKFRVTE